MNRYFSFFSQSPESYKRKRTSDLRFLALEGTRRILTCSFTNNVSLRGSSAIPLEFDFVTFDIDDTANINIDAATINIDRRASLAIRKDTGRRRPVEGPGGSERF